MKSSDPGPHNQQAIFCFLFFIKQTRQKSASLELLIRLLPFVVTKLLPKNKQID